MAEDKPKPRREHGCLSLLLGLGFIVLVLTLLFGWDIGGRHYGVACSDGQIRLLWGEEKGGETSATTASEQTETEPSSSSE
jgi:hypothetical protein